jgi:peptidoglycan hydrolase CwlO-like protein
MKKSVLILSVAAAVGFGGTLSFSSFESTAFASKIQDLNSQKSELQDKRSAVNSKIEDANAEINQVQNDQAAVKTELGKLNLAIGDTENKIYEKQGQVDETKAEIKKLQEEITVVTKRIEKRNELLKDRARSYQENGSTISYIDVLLGAKSFSDFIDRVGAIATIVEADQGILKEHKRDKNLLEKTQTEVKSKLSSLQGMLSDLQTMKSNLNSEKAKKDQLMASLKEQEVQLKEAKLSLEEEKQILSAQANAVQKAIEIEKQRLAAQQNSSSGGSSGGGSVPPVSSGAFTRPAEGYLSSGFRTGDRPDHHGIDIAKAGTVPIVAAADGYVLRSYTSSSYGECIFITHSVKGQIYTTVYAHMRSGSRQVSEGATVSKGQIIGYMGNTGDSYGQHLHFEVHRGTWESDKRNAINPLGVVPF